MLISKRELQFHMMFHHRVLFGGVGPARLYLTLLSSPSGIHTQL